MKMAVRKKNNKRFGQFFRLILMLSDISFPSVYNGSLRLSLFGKSNKSRSHRKILLQDIIVALESHQV